MSATVHTVSTGGDRQLRVVEDGQADGVPVLVHAGTPGSALLHHSTIEDARSRGIRLISYDRAGYGGSSPQPGRNVASIAEDVRAIAATLGIERLLVWGHSGGGPHALACAALLPELVVAAAALSGVAPYGAEGLDWLAGMGEGNVKEFGAARAGRETLHEYLERDAASILAADPQALMRTWSSLLSPPDAAVLTTANAQYLVETVRAGIEKSREGWEEDDLAFTKDWGFEPGQIQIPVMLMHGRQDQMAPFSHSKWLAGRIPGVQTRFLPDDGHLTVAFNRIPEVHAWLLANMN